MLLIIPMIHITHIIIMILILSSIFRSCPWRCPGFQLAVDYYYSLLCRSPIKGDNVLLRRWGPPQPHRRRLGALLRGRSLVLPRPAVTPQATSRVVDQHRPRDDQTLRQLRQQHCYAGLPAAGVYHTVVLLQGGRARAIFCGVWHALGRPSQARVTSF